MPNSRTYIPVEIGSTTAGVTILEQTNQPVKPQHRSFRVRHLCCGSEGDLTYFSIVQRRARGTTICRGCRNQRARAAKAHNKKAVLRPQRKHAIPIDAKWGDAFMSFFNWPATSIGVASARARASDLR